MEKNYLKQSRITELTGNPYINLVSTEHNVIISECLGGIKASLAYAQKIFSGFLDSNFKKWNLDTAQPATEKIDVEVWEISSRYGDYSEIYNAFNVELKNLKFNSQEQIEKFVYENWGKWLRPEGYALLFLFSEIINNKEEFFVVCTCLGHCLCPSNFQISVARLSDSFNWLARYGRYCVLPVGWNREARLNENENQVSDLKSGHQNSDWDRSSWGSFGAQI